MNSVPNEVIELIVKNSDLETRFNYASTEHRVYVTGKKHLKPVVKRYSNGRIESKTWINTNGSTSGTTSGTTNGSTTKRIMYFRNNEANEKYAEYWYKNGRKHREGGPASMFYTHDGGKYEEWYRNGQRHREGGKPAYIEWNHLGEKIEEEWWVHGMRIR